jgi:DNA-binding response OmpR family regulator
MSKILIVEDDEDIAELERDYLEASGFDTALAADGRKGLSLALGGGFDLVILDLMLPGEDGLSVCRSIRERSGIPVIMVTARSEDIDVIRGLGIGANDYVTKPFSPSVLVARVKACLAFVERASSAATAAAETNEPQADDLVFGDVRICPASHTVSVADSEVTPPTVSTSCCCSWPSAPTLSLAGRPSTSACGARTPWATAPRSRST